MCRWIMIPLLGETLRRVGAFAQIARFNALRSRHLAEYKVGGIRTNTNFFREVLADPDFQGGRLSTAFLDTFFARQTHSPARQIRPGRGSGSRV